MTMPFAPTTTIGPGEHRLSLGDHRDGLLFVPRNAPHDTGAPLLLILHGAGGSAALGIPNGDLFTHVLAFSPGFVSAGGRRGKPRIFISHGTQDRVLPIERTSRVIVPDLERSGYDVRYREFGGPHAVPPSIAREAFQWFTR